MEQEGQNVKGKSSAKEAVVAIVILAIVVVAALVGYSAINAQQKEEATSDVQAYKLEAPAGGASSSANAFLACEIFDAAGSAVTVGDVAAGKPVVLNVWATWCPYCVVEMPDFQKLYEKYGSEVQFVMLNVCDSAHEAQAGKDYLADEKFTFPAYYDSGHAVSKLFGITGLPTTIVANADGEVLMNRPGKIDPQSMDATLSKLRNN